MSKADQLRSLLTPAAGVVVPGAYDAWTARLVEDAGFPAVYVTGAGVANAMLGQPDIGLVTETEMAQQLRRIADVVHVPIFADADTGYGGVANVRRTVRDFEHAGAAGLHIEDQEHPKRCGHFDGKIVVSISEMCLRITAALAARREQAFVVIARTDAFASEGRAGVIARGKQYLAAGADGLFIDAPTSLDDLAAFGEAFAGTVLVANMTEGGRTPLLGADRLADLGFSLVLYPNLTLRIGASAMRRGLETLRNEGSSKRLLPEILAWDARQELVGLPEAMEFEADILSTSGARARNAR